VRIPDLGFVAPAATRLAGLLPGKVRRNMAGTS
jgi:hypothetical protein